MSSRSRAAGDFAGGRVVVELVDEEVQRACNAGRVGFVDGDGAVYLSL